MTQRTLVLKVPADRAQDLERRLRTGDFEWRSVPHAVFSVKGAGTVATLYSSGKFVVQGAEPELFVARYTDLESPSPPSASTTGAASAEGSAPAGDPSGAFDEPLIGSDETGKGDYFGPLVVAAVRLEPEAARELQEWGVADSKRLSDDRALKLAVLLRPRVEHVVRRLDPPEYNASHGERKLNEILAEQHAEAIRALAHPGDRVLVDQFADESVMRAALEGVDVRLMQAHRAERFLAVAAASVLARAEFLLALQELSSQWGVELQKGAGEPTDLVGVRFAREHGFEALGRVAKLHFKNTGKIEKRLG